MIEITTILAAAALALAIARWQRIPSVPVLILSGVALSASPWAPAAEVLESLLFLGLTFLVFAAGTELNPTRIGEQKRAAIQVGLAQFLLVGGIGQGVTLALGFDRLSGVYMGLAMAASSTLVVVRLLQQRQQFFEPFGRLVLGVLLVQDIMVVFFISALAQYGNDPVVLGAAKFFVLLALALVLIRWITPLLLLKLGLDEETLLLVVLAILFTFAGLSALLGVPLVVGAFLAGVSLSSFPVNGVIRGQLSSLSHFFLATFFVALGATLQFPGSTEMLLTVLLALLVLIVTPPLVTFVAETAGLSARTGIESGLLLAQTSEFSLLLALVGVQSGHIPQEILGVIALVTVITMMLTPLIATNKVTWRLMKLHPSRWQTPPVNPPRDHILLIGCGESGAVLLDELRRSGERLLVLENDPAIVEQLQSAGVEAIRGDGADYKMLGACGAKTARIVISTMGRVKDSESLLKFARRRNVLVRVFEEQEAERIRRLGGIPVVYSQAAAAEFLRWFETEFSRSD